MKKYIDISGFNIKQPNRGNAALSYGSLGFLLEKGMIDENDELIYFHAFNNFLKKDNICVKHENYKINGRIWKRTIVPIHNIEKWIVSKLGIIIPFTPFGNYSAPL